jgi:ankyrin repeat protein
MFPLLVCLKKHSFEIAEDLLLFNANINFKRDNGSSLLHEAVLSDDLEMLRWILGQKNIKTKLNVNVKDSNEKTPLIRSIESEHPTLFVELLSYNGIDIYCRDESNRNIIHMIVWKSKVEHLKIFIAKAVTEGKVYQKLFSEVWGPKAIPVLHMAVDTKNFKVVATLVTIMMKLGCDLKQANGEGQTALDRINQMASNYVGEFITSKQPQEKKDLEDIVKIRQFLENNM